MTENQGFYMHHNLDMALPLLNQLAEGRKISLFLLYFKHGKCDISYLGSRLRKPEDTSQTLGNMGVHCTGQQVWLTHPEVVQTTGNQI